MRLYIVEKHFILMVLTSPFSHNTQPSITHNSTRLSACLVLILSLIREGLLSGLIAALLSVNYMKGLFARNRR